ncbi:hypothetical protein EMN47_12245 [Prolixibacteraceae bacterium JC049]|nr:hypothetical protein [Prolixibacteraceae bacterium JC049]
MRKEFLLGICALVGVGTIQKVHAQNKRPNVLFILTDDENINTLGCYGNNVTTPNIDKLAKNGIRFTNANVVHTVCSPSRYSIITGRYYDNNYHPKFLKNFPSDKPSCVGNTIMLENDGMNLAGVLKQNGYNTGFVGKFHLGRHEVLGTNRNWKANGLKTYGRDEDPRVNSEMNQKLKSNHKWWCNAIKEFGFDYVNGVYSANMREFFNKNMNAHNVEWTADASIKFIEQQKDKADPFFLFVGTTYPHGPAPEKKVNGKYIASLDADPSITGEGIVLDGKEEKIAARQKIKNSIKKDQDKKSATAQWWDASVGAIIAKLKETGQYENTLIIYTSDHGKRNGSKTTLYEGGVHVPLIVHWANNIKSERIYNNIVGSIDITPTILDVCDANIPSKMKMDGISFKSVIEGQEKATREALLLRMGYACGVKTNNWKYIALRYPVADEKAIQQGKTFIGHRKETISQPYYMLHKQLSQKAAKNNKHYFERNQLFEYKKDKRENKNLYLENKMVAAKMHSIMAKELQKVNSKRSYGEFVGTDKAAFNHLKFVINYPE